MKNINLLQGKKGIIFGALDERSIAWKVAEKCHAEGAKFTLTNAPVALRFGTILELAKKYDLEVIPADATSVPDLENVFAKSMEILGGKVDFVLHSIGMSPNMRTGNHYTGLNYRHYHKTLDISAMSLHKTLQTAMKLDAINEWGSVVALTYIGAQRVFPDYSDMSDAKAMLESVARNFGYHYGVKKKVRINTVSQSPTMTTAGSGVKGINSFIAFADAMSPLGNAGSADCANFCATLFSDLTRYVTMQNIFHDGGFSNTGFSEAAMTLMK